MRVLMLGWELPPHNSGGLGVACYQLCRALAQRDIDIDFVLPYQADHDTHFMNVLSVLQRPPSAHATRGHAYDSPIYRATELEEPGYDLFTQEQQFEVAVEELVHTQQYDILHAHDWLTFRAALRAKEAIGCPIILHVHSIESDRAGGQPGNPLAREIEAVAFHLADTVIAVSDFTKCSIVREYGIPASRIEVVHNCIERSEMLIQESMLATTYQYLASLRAQGWRVVSSIGRLTIQKGIPNLLRTAQKVIQRLPKTMFLIAGNGEQYNELVGLSAELGIARNVIFTDFLRGKPWRDAFSIADLFVMPSVSEPFGITPLEAIGYGTSALISRQSGVSEVLHNALKVDFWDTDEMANQIIAAVRSQSMTYELVNNAKQELQKLSWGRAADRIINIYEHQLVGSV